MNFGFRPIISPPTLELVTWLWYHLLVYHKYSYRSQWKRTFISLYTLPHSLDAWCWTCPFAGIRACNNSPSHPLMNLVLYRPPPNNIHQIIFTFTKWSWKLEGWKKMWIISIIQSLHVSATIHLRLDNNLGTFIFHISSCVEIIPTILNWCMYFISTKSLSS